jgi:hypothetical protein
MLSALTFMLKAVAFVAVGAGTVTMLPRLSVKLCARRFEANNWAPFVRKTSVAD